MPTSSAPGIAHGATHALTDDVRARSPTSAAKLENIKPLLPLGEVEHASAHSVLARPVCVPPAVHKLPPRTPRLMYEAILN